MIVVPSNVLAKVPFSTLLSSDDVAVSARLESLEKCMKVLTETVTKIAAPNTGTFAGARARVNSNSMHSVAGSQGQGQDRSGGVPQVVVSAPASESLVPSWQTRK